MVTFTDITLQLICLHLNTTYMDWSSLHGPSSWSRRDARSPNNIQAKWEYCQIDEIWETERSRKSSSNVKRKNSSRKSMHVRSVLQEGIAIKNAARNLSLKRRLHLQVPYSTVLLNLFYSTFFSILFLAKCWFMHRYLMMSHFLNWILWLWWGWMIKFVVDKVLSAQRKPIWCIIQVFSYSFYVSWVHIMGTFC